MGISYIAGNSVDSAQTDANHETGDSLPSDADYYADDNGSDDYADDNSSDDYADDNGIDDEADFEKYREDETEGKSDQLSPKDKDIRDVDKDSVKSIGQGKEVKGLSFKHLTQDSTSCKEGSNIAQNISVNSSAHRKIFMGPKSAKERWVKKMKARQEATVAEENDAQLDSDLINLVQGISKTIPEQQFSDSDGEGVERSAGVDFILGFDDMHIEPVERDSKVTETGNGAEDDLDRETVHRSESSGDIIESSSLEQPPKESKVSNNIDSGNVERSEAIVSSRSNVGEPGNVQAGDLDHEHGNKSDETVDRSAGIAGSDSNVGQPGNVEAG